MKKTAALLIAAVLLLCFLPAYAFADTALDGSGTETDPYQIGDLDDLKTFAAEVSGGNTFADAFVVLTNDITDDGTFPGIGFISATDNVAFEGTFDGCGHTITLAMAPTLAPTIPIPVASFGLFANIGTNGIVENVIVDGTMTGSGSFGGICYTNNGLIRNCGSYVKLTDNGMSMAITYAAGICSLNDGVIVNCFYYGRITIKAANSTNLACIASTTSNGTSKVLNCCYDLTGKNVSVTVSAFTENVLDIDDTYAEDLNDGLADYEEDYGPLKPWIDDEDDCPVLLFSDAPAHVHTADLTAKTEAKAATCSEAGNVEWYACTDPTCEAKLDADGNEITDVVLPIDPSAHQWGGWTESSDGTYCERVCIFTAAHTQRTDHTGISCDNCGWKILPEITAAPEDAPAELLARAKITRVLQNSPDLLKNNVSTSEEYTDFRSWVIDNGINHRDALTEDHAYLSYALDLDEILENADLLITEDTLAVTEIVTTDDSVTVTVQIDGIDIGENACRLNTVFGAIGADSADGTYSDCVCSDFTVNDDGSVTFSIAPESGSTDNFFFKVTCVTGAESAHNGFRITYSGEGLTSRSVPATSLPDPFPVPERAEYVFVGWYLDSTLNEQAVAGTALTADTALYASWRSLAEIKDSAKDSVIAALGADLSEERQKIAADAISAIDTATTQDVIEQLRSEAVAALAEDLVRALVSSGDTSATVSVTNGTSLTGSVQIIAAAYTAEGRMVAVKIDTCTLESAGSHEITLNYTAADNVTKICVFLLRNYIPVELRWTMSV